MYTLHDQSDNMDILLIEWSRVLDPNVQVLEGILLEKGPSELWFCHVVTHVVNL